MQYTNEGDPAQEGTEQEQNEHNAQIRAMQQKPPCSTPIKETQHRRTQNKTNEMPRLGPCNTEHKRTKHNAQIRAMQRAGKPVKGQGKDDHQRQWRRHHGRPIDGGGSDDGEQTEIA